MTRRSRGIAVALVPGGLGAVLPALAAADALRGETVYARCAACHALAFDRVGPRHCGLSGRRAGSVPGFAYSPAMKQSAIVWDVKALDRFLASPVKAIPGTTMTYDGVPDLQERADLIAYLRQVDQTPACPWASAIRAKVARATCPHAPSAPPLGGRVCWHSCRRSD